MYQHNKLNCFAHQNNIFHHQIKKEATQGEQQTPTTRRCHHGKTYNIANWANMRNWAKKTIKQSAKTLQKIRQAWEYTYNNKKQKNQANKQTNHVQYGCRNMPENAEIIIAKKLHY